MLGNNVQLPVLRSAFSVVARDLGRGQDQHLSRINVGLLRDLAASLGVTDIAGDNNHPMTTLGAREAIARFILARMQAAIAMDPPDLSEIRKVRKQIVDCMELGIVIEGEPDLGNNNINNFEPSLQIINAFLKHQAANLFSSTAFYQGLFNKIQNLYNFFGYEDNNLRYNPNAHNIGTAFDNLIAEIRSITRQLVPTQQHGVGLCLQEVLAFSEQLESLLVIKNKLIIPAKPISNFDLCGIGVVLAHVVDVYGLNSSLFYGAFFKVLPEFKLSANENYIWKFQSQIALLLPFVGLHRLYSGYNQGKLSPQSASPERSLARSLMLTSGLWAGAWCLIDASVGSAASAAIAPIMWVYSAYALYDIGFALGNYRSAVEANPSAPTTIGKSAIVEMLSSTAFLAAAFHVFYTLPAGINPEGVIAPINIISSILNIHGVESAHSALLGFTILTTCLNSYSNGRSCDHRYVGRSLQMAAISGVGIAVAACFAGTAAAGISSAYLATNIAYAAGDLVGYYRGV